MLDSEAGTVGARGVTGPPIFGKSVNPIPTGEGRLFPPNTTGTPNVFHLPALLHNKDFFDLLFFFGEKAILEESYEPSLDKLHSPTALCAFPPGWKRVN